MDIRTLETAMRRSRKAFAHSVARLAEAESDRAKARHARRARNAQRRMGEAVWEFEAYQLAAPD